MTARLMILNGPNLNLLGVREPHIYGLTTLAAIKASCEEFARSAGAQLSFHQSNHEGALVDLIQAARDEADAIIINPAAFSFTSIAMLDALKAFEGPIIEVLIPIFTRGTAASSFETVVCRQGGYLRFRTLWLHSCHAGGASHSETIAGQLTDPDPCRPVMGSCPILTLKRPSPPPPEGLLTEMLRNVWGRCRTAAHDPSRSYGSEE